MSLAMDGLLCFVVVCTHIACDSQQMDHDPKNPSYIATQGPLAQTVSDFWQVGCYAMSIVILNCKYLIIYSPRAFQG